MDNKEFLNGWFQDFVENFGTNVWKIAPFRAGNRMWLAVLLKAYAACIAGCIVLACVINSIEGKRWLQTDVNGKSWSRARGDGALDETIWFVVTTVHGVGFGEFVSHGPARWVSMICVSLGYWFQIFLCSIVMLSQLPGERVPSLYNTTARIVSAVWPSYLVFMLIMVAIGSTLADYLSHDQFANTNWHITGTYFAWQVAHRMPFGDIFPTTPYARVMTCVLAIMGLLYMPYALALVAVRCPTLEEHENLLGRLRKNPDAALGRGYIAPRDGNNMREIVMQEYTPEPVC